MAYKVLYRKYRPQNFNDLYGQDSIKQLLIDSINNDKLSHAYLFSGPRGTGKTSTAKLFAKTINCENSSNGIPCNQCESCKNYNESPDIIEIDAASNNGVDEIRDLRDNAKILPTYSKYKIYIIDEVHMLSQSAWNAFLKILEEPPKHVIFILATTEIQKIPITILSRCQRFTFQKISSEIIQENLLRISQEENIDLTEEGANYIAILSDGGMRDALSILDQLSKENIPITKELIINTFGLITENDVEKIFDNLKDKNIHEIEIIFNEYSNKGLDINLLISKIINYIYKMEFDSINEKIYTFSRENLKKMASELINCYNKSEALTLVKIILLSYIPDDINKEIDSQIISREIICENNHKDKDSLIEDTNKNEKVVANLNNIERKKVIRLNNSFVSASKVEKEKFKKSWEIFKNKEITKNNVEILSLIEDLNIEVVSPTNVLFSHKSPSTTLLFNQSTINLEQEFYEFEKYPIKFICITSEEWEQRRKEYISNKDKKYTYIEEQELDNNLEIVESAMDIFDSKIIEIN